MTLVVHDHQLMTKLCYFGMVSRDPLASLLHDLQVRLYSLSLDCVATVALEIPSRCIWEFGIACFCLLVSTQAVIHLPMCFNGREWFRNVE